MYKMRVFSFQAIALCSLTKEYIARAIDGHISLSFALFFSFSLKLHAEHGMECLQTL